MLLKTLLIPFFFFFFFNLSPTLLLAASPYPHDKTLTGRFERSPLLSSSKRYEGSSDLVHVRYHMGPVLSAPIRLHLIWYGRWLPAQQAPIRDFLLSLSDADGKNSSSPPPAVASPSVADWWRSTACLYTDQTGANVTSGFALAQEYRDAAYSHGTSLSRLSVQSVIRSAVTGCELVTFHSILIQQLRLIDNSVLSLALSITLEAETDRRQYRRLVIFLSILI